MTMLAILIGYTLERFLNDIDQYRTYQWFDQFIDWIQSLLRSFSWWNGTLTVLLILFIPVFFIAWLHHLIADVLILDFLFSVIILLYCFGPRDLHESARLFIEAREQDDQTTAKAHAQHLLGEQLPEDDSELFYEIGKSVLIATNVRLLAVFFWFFVLGPMGAILYRLTQIMLKHFSEAYTEDDDEKHQLLHTTRLLFAIINFIPAHLTALCYAVIGSFIDALHEWKASNSCDPLNPDDCNSMLVRTGLGSLRMDANSVAFDQSSLQTILDMSWRTTLVWLTVVALMTMAGWAS